MASLSPQLSRSNSQSNLNASEYQSSDDGYDYNMVDDGPEREPTRKNHLDLQVNEKDATAVRRSEEPDHAYTESEHLIWQRTAGGRRAKVPGDLESGIVNDTTPNVNGPTPPNDNDPTPPKPKVVSIRLRWTMPEFKGRRHLALDAGKAELDAPGPGLQRRRVRWHHSNQPSLKLGTLESTINECQSQVVSSSERGLTRRLIRRVRTLAEKEFVGGRFLTPTAIRYDSQDISRYTVDKTCIFFSFPYFYIDKPKFRKHYRKEDQHPPRTLLQSRYRLNKTIDRDEYQCISMLEKVNSTEQGMPEWQKRKHRVGPNKADENLVYVPQLWGVIAGLDTLITYGPIDDAMLRGSAIKISNHIPRPDKFQLSLVRIRFTYQNRHEDLIWPVIQCDSWFGLLNKQQQILELLSTGKEKARPSEYRFWFKNKEQITIGNWASLLHDSQSDEIVDIWMKKEMPKIHVQRPEEDNIRMPTRQLTFDGSGLDDMDKNKTIPIVSPFLAWDILDEFGEADQVSKSTRVNRFLEAIYKHVTAVPDLHVDGVTQESVRDYVSGLNNDFVSVLWNDFQLIFRSYVPEEPDLAKGPTEMYWDAVYVIVQTFADDHFERSDRDQYSKLVSGIVSHARRLHQGVYRSPALKDDTGRWQHKDAVAEGAILLAVMVDALGEIFQMVAETVRCIRSGTRISKDSAPFEHGKDACEFLKAARDQLIREADGRDKNGNVGPVVTPEAITISLLERLSSGVDGTVDISGVSGDGTVDITNLYEQCLEHLALKVEYEASRRLLKKMNIFQEEITIIKTVLNQQISVLDGLRKSLNPNTFNTPSITRKLRHNFECKAIDKILLRIQEQTKNCDELLDRAKLIAIQNVQLVETFQDDNSKAIFVFTIVTVLFLPMGFVASFFGMNVIGISNTVTTLRHFWTISLSLTFGLVIPCTIAALKGEEVYFLVARTNRALRKLWSGRKNEE